MLGLRNIILLSPPPQTTRPSPTNYSTVEDKAGGEKVCKDCGNRAKKECLFERCRTCCKSRGYNCATHVKSTWVPSSSSSSDKNKKLKIDKQSSANVSLTTSRQERSFKKGLPGKIEAPAVFRRTRVTAISNNEQAEIGYQATVTISGHVFKGFLHYYGVDHNKAFPCLSQK
ncbi:Protein SHI RELATED SEQUENCE 6 [Cardamine amara subsp. amara]|uniref:Protein SHI RELATED SEQUENCE 6 n=1 Tax=Cardamine amara subsp. amara TaxID=228776 RepID=A0ABD1B6T4_CARAN